ncbi:NADP-dependent oxidoreductase [Paenibacillus radicis (ex Gao et al. 2016)]|uniref:NADPH:quinone reductase n=1 Tax=Paenibacillus radicis (ex Gao et al. 2016) TaxID=1737354 RepID=A0A917LW11_9BACL|nr:NADP-dependent oxidoreductase [Paenibacillus radicis (ex Gao et al. 2016)]GGG60377.1 NADPH:quinone reductase [Paenibacillus radicis (ex Gao et al. 2016)]
MKAIVIDAYKRPLRFAELQLPELGEHDVRVEIYAASLNPIDYKLRDGLLRLIQKYDFPLILGHDLAGIVTAIGSKVSKFSVGDEVYGRPRGSRIGTLAEYISVHEDDISLKPQNVSFEEAASIPLIGLTTFQAFTGVMALQKDQKILIHAGAGGIGTFAIQLAKAMGAYVATTTSENGYDLVKRLGADLIINYKQQPFENIIQDYDAVYDTLGGDVLKKSFTVLKPHGKLVSIAGLPGGNFAREAGLGPLKTALFSIVGRRMTALAAKNNVDYDYHYMKPSGLDLSSIKQLIEANQIKPVIDKIFDFQDTAKAFAYLETGRAKGKVVVSVK